MKFLELEVVQTNVKVERVSTKKLDDVLSQQKSFSNKSNLEYTCESSSAANISKKVKFVKAKVSMVAAKNTDKVKSEKKNNVTEQRFMTKSPKQSVVKPKGNGKYSQSHKKVRELNTSAITMEFKVTPDPIVINCKH